MGALDLSKVLKQQQEQAMAAMFGEGESGITEISVFDLKEYEDQPFRPYASDKLNLLAEDIKKNGILSPIIVRKFNATESSPLYYQILAGHNRVRAAKIAQIEKVPAIIKTDISDDEAAVIMTTTNLNQRDELLPSEKAFAYKIKFNAIKRQAGRHKKNEPHNEAYLKTRENEPHNEAHLKTSEMIAQEFGESKAKIERYIKLTELIPPLLDMVDNKELAFMVGYHLSFLSDDEQMLVMEYTKENKIKLNVQNAEAIKRYSTEVAVLSKEILDTLFSKEKKEKKSQAAKVKINDDIVAEFFFGKTNKEITEEVNFILEKYFDTFKADVKNNYNYYEEGKSK